jgi:hypothetical protein
MRLAMRALILLALPGLVFGWAASLSILSAPPPGRPLTFVIVGVVLVLAGSVLVTLTDVATLLRAGVRIPRRPVAWPAAALVAYISLGTLTTARAGLDSEEKLLLWPAVGLTVALVFVALLTAVVLARSLAGMWSASELPMWPGRRVAIVLLVNAALLAAPVVDVQPWTGDFFNSDFPVVPFVEKVRMDLTGDTGVWIYAFGGGSGLLR